MSAARRRIRRSPNFFLIVIGIFGAVDAYLSISLRLSWPLVGLLTMAFLTILWLPFVFWRSDSEETSVFAVFMQWLAFTLMGWISLLWAATVVRDVISIFVSRPLHTSAQTGALALIASGAFLLGAINAYFGVRVKEVEVEIEGLPRAMEGLRIAQVSDLHAGTTIRRRMISRIAGKVERANPDLFVITGDAVDGNVGELGPQLEPLTRLKPKFGKFYVPGNHEYYWGAAPWIEKFHEMGFHALTNAHAVVAIEDARLVIAGVTDPAAREMGGDPPSLKRALKGAAGFPKILLAHRPNFASVAEKAGFQLQLSGHTHGGQFFPWTLVAKWVHQYPYGLHRVKGMWLYVSRGTGYWGPPVRLGAPPEVTVLVLMARR
jgi:predicted MPP superfamily phosphohydrolase